MKRVNLSVTELNICFVMYNFFFYLIEVIDLYFMLSDLIMV